MVIARVALVFGFFGLISGDSKIVVVTGATGRSGIHVVEALKKESGVEVRALVRNATKARAVLGCNKCDESEGIFIGDVNNPKSLEAVMQNATGLIITTASEVSCEYGFVNCKYQRGESPKDINFESVKTQVTAFATSPGQSRQQRHVVLMSTMDTTVPDNFLDKLGGGHVTFYSLNGEAFLMSSGLRWTVVKACGLSDGPAMKNRLVTGHDDKGFSMVLDHSIARADVARVLSAAVMNPAKGAGLRFDLCSTSLGSAQSDATVLLEEAMYPWDMRKPSMPDSILV